MARTFAPTSHSNKFVRLIDRALVGAPAMPVALVAFGIMCGKRVAVLA